jgi:thymidylate synthase (FAD)
MHLVDPYVAIVARTYADDDAIAEYLDENDARDWATSHHFESPEDLVEFAGRSCYRSFGAGLNKNVSKVREDQGEYIRNILSSAHGSVIEHVTWTFAIQGVSRIVTHELARHRVGVAISQESGRYVAFDGSFPMPLPSWAIEDREFMDQLKLFMFQAENFQHWMAEHFDLHKPGQKFAYKKHITSFMRRFAPEGRATALVWTANARTLRHVIAERTAAGAEDEIRELFAIIAQIMTTEHPMLFGDIKEQTDGSWKPEWRKV